MGLCTNLTGFNNNKNIAQITKFLHLTAQSIIKTVLSVSNNKFIQDNNNSKLIVLILSSNNSRLSLPFKDIKTLIPVGLTSFNTSSRTILFKIILLSFNQVKVTKIKIGKNKENRANCF